MASRETSDEEDQPARRRQRLEVPSPRPAVMQRELPQYVLLTLRRKNVLLYHPQHNWRRLDFEAPFWLPETPDSGSYALLHASSSLLCLLITRRHRNASRTVFRVWNLSTNTWEDVPGIGGDDPSIASWNEWRILNDSHQQQQQQQQLPIAVPSSGFPFIAFRDRALSLLFVHIALYRARSDCYRVLIGVVRQRRLNNAPVTVWSYSSRLRSWHAEETTFEDSMRMDINLRATHAQTCIPPVTMPEDSSVIQLGTHNASSRRASAHREAGIYEYSAVHQEWITPYPDDIEEDETNGRDRGCVVNEICTFDYQPPAELIMYGTSLYCAAGFMQIAVPTLAGRVTRLQHPQSIVAFEIWQAQNDWGHVASMPPQYLPHFISSCKILASHRYIFFVNMLNNMVHYDTFVGSWAFAPYPHAPPIQNRLSNYDVTILDRTVNTCLMRGSTLRHA